MFTGIIETLAKVVAVEREGTNLHLTLESDLTNALKIDQSLAHNGVCLTVIKIDGSKYTVTAIEETLLKSAIGDLEVGNVVNLERAMQLPPNYSESHSSEWMNAYIPAIKCIYRELERVTVVKKIETVETIDTSKVHEPFRNAMSRQTDILYKWCCMCDVGLDKGFCSHVFFCEHQSGTSPIPESPNVLSASKISQEFCISKSI